MGESAPKSVPAQRIQTVCLVVLTFIAVGATLYVLRKMLIPFVLAIFLAILLSPAVDFFARRLRLPRAVAIVGTLLLGVVILFGIGLVISASVSQLSAKSDLYEKRLQQLTDKVTEKIDPLFAMFEPEEEPEAGAEEADAEAGKPRRKPPMLSKESVMDALLGTLDSIASLLSQGVIVLIFLAFLLAGRKPVHGIGWEIEASIKRYVATKIFVSALTGVLVGSIYFTLGIDLAIVFGLFAFLLNFIPNVGSLIAVLLPLPVIILSPEVSTVSAIIAIGLPIVVNTLIGNVLEPQMMGKAMDLHPIAVLLALIFWGFLWGIIGMLLAVPMTVCARILMEKLELTAPIARLLAGRFGQEQA